jgi:hypothetical protein
LIDLLVIIFTVLLDLIKLCIFIGIPIMEIWEVKITLLTLLVYNNISIYIIINFILLNLVTITIGIRYILLQSLATNNIQVLNTVNL